jgi:hypothetical protein
MFCCFLLLLLSRRAVTLPDGVSSGQVIHVQAPDGAVNAITVPPGFGPGSTFTVEFVPPEKHQPVGQHQQYTETKYEPPGVGPTPTPVAPAVAGGDDFASGFGHPPVAAATTSFSDAYYAQYATPAQQQQQATPVYPKW